MPHAELLHSQLHAQGLSVFFDAASLRLDEPWEPQIAVAMSSSIVVVLLISHAAVEGTSMRCILLPNQTHLLFAAQSRATLLMPRPHDYLLLEHLLAGEVHLRNKCRVIPVYIGRCKTDGTLIHPVLQPPQGCYTKCDTNNLFPPLYGECSDDVFSKRFQTVMDRLSLGAPRCSGSCLRTLLTQV